RASRCSRTSSASPSRCRSRRSTPRSSTTSSSCDCQRQKPGFHHQGTKGTKKIKRETRLTRRARREHEGHQEKPTASPILLSAVGFFSALGKLRRMKSRAPVNNQESPNLQRITRKRTGRKQSSCVVWAIEYSPDTIIY